MKRYLFLFAVFFFLVGCAVGGPSGPTAAPTEAAEATHTLEPTIDIAAVETEVQQTLEVMLLTLSPAVTDTPVPTETAAPTLTLAPTETPTPTSTLPPTNTPVPIEIVNPTATLDSTNPNLDLGNYTFMDTFKDGGNWNLYETAESKAEAANGKLLYTIFSVDNPTVWTLSWMQSQNFYAKVTVKTAAACGGKDAYGMVFRAVDPSHTYILSVSCDGDYRVARTSAAGFDILRHWTASDHINIGPNQTNEIGVLMTGSAIRVYINGKYIESIVDETYPEKGYFGLLIGSDVTDNFQVEYDNFVYWTLP